MPRPLFCICSFLLTRAQAEDISHPVSLHELKSPLGLVSDPLSVCVSCCCLSLCLSAYFLGFSLCPGQATGGKVQTSIHGITADVVGHCEKFEERQLGNERWNLFTGCPKARTATIILRGGSEQVHMHVFCMYGVCLFIAVPWVLLVGQRGWHLPRGMLLYRLRKTHNTHQFQLAHSSCSLFCVCLVLC